MSKAKFRNITIAALGLIVVIVLFFLVKPMIKKSPLLTLSAPAPRPAVTDADYRAHVISAFSVFKINDPASAESVRERLLALIVPAEEKEIHLAMVLKLTAYDDALKSGMNADKTYKNLIAIADKNQWLKSVSPFSNQ